MISIATAFWLEKGRIAAQSVWMGCFVAALWGTLGALHWPHSRRIENAARGLWRLAMALLIALWLGGATLEMMRRAASVSGARLIVALGAFSLLIAGVLSLGREWFGPGFTPPLRAGKIALSLLVLSVAGWWLGGLALHQNPVWLLTPDFLMPSASTTRILTPAPFLASNTRMPDAWALLLGGATLLGASRSVQPRDKNALKVRNPRAATWWLGGMTLLLEVPWGWPLTATGIGNPGAASVLAGAGAVFGLKVWRARHDCPRLGRLPLIGRVAGVALLGAAPWIWVVSWHGSQQVFSPGAWLTTLSIAWHEPHQSAAWLMISGALVLLLTGLRQNLRRAIFDRFSDRALLQGALVGWVLASVFFGPGGAVFWAFWPLCGLFFDLLVPREPIRCELRPAPIAAELPAHKLAPAASAP